MAENVGDVALLCICRAKNDTQTRNDFRRIRSADLEAC